MDKVVWTGAKLAEVTKVWIENWRKLGSKNAVTIACKATVDTWRHRYTEELRRRRD